MPALGIALFSDKPDKYCCVIAHLHDTDLWQHQQQQSIRGQLAALPLQPPCGAAQEKDRSCAASLTLVHISFALLIILIMTVSTHACRAAQEKDRDAALREREAGKLQDAHARKQQGLTPLEAELENLRK